jgi:predicted nucleic acid-binding protein
MAGLGPFNRLDILEPYWETVGDLLAELRAAGTPIPLPDVIQAVVAIQCRIPLWTKDAHFQFVKSVEPRLQLFVP